MVVTPYRKAWIFLGRYLLVMFVVLSVVAVGVRPQEYLLLMAPGLALGGITFFGGLVLGEEIGLGLSLGWWGLSFTLAVARLDLLKFETATWFLLILSHVPLSPAEVMLEEMGSPWDRPSSSRFCLNCGRP